MKTAGAAGACHLLPGHPALGFSAKRIPTRGGLRSELEGLVLKCKAVYLNTHPATNVGPNV